MLLPLLLNNLLLAVHDVSVSDTIVLTTSGFAEVVEEIQVSDSIFVERIQTVLDVTASDTLSLTDSQANSRVIDVKTPLPVTTVFF